jgi:hypothetical protein
VFGFRLTSDLRYIISISNKFITWDLSTSDLTRDVNPGIEGIMQQLELSPDNRFAAAYTNNNQASLVHHLSGLALGPTQPLIQRLQQLFLRELQQLVHEADHSPPSSAEIKNVWSSTSTPLYVFMA